MGDGSTGVTEDYEYDSMNRLSNVNLTTDATGNYHTQEDLGLGNIKTKTHAPKGETEQSTTYEYKINNPYQLTKKVRLYSR